MATEAVDSILKKYITQKRSRGAFTERELDKYAPEEPVVVDGVMKSTAGSVLSSDSEFDAIAKPVLTSWLKGKGGLNRVASGGLWDKDTVGGATANQYFANAKKFDNPTLPLTERITNMIYGAETSGNPNAWKTQNQYGFMGRAQIGEPFMQDYGIDKKRYMSDPKYQHEATMSAVQRRIDELSGKYYKLPSMRNFEKGGLSGPLKKLYPEDDNTEDLLIVDPTTGHPYGGLRLGERIFSQRDTIRMDKLASGKNYDKLGKFVAKAISRHDEDETMFAGGGKLGDPTVRQMKENRLKNLEEFKGKMPDSLYNKYYKEIEDARTASEASEAYKRAVADWGDGSENGSSQAPNARQVQSFKQSKIRDLKSLGVPNSIISRYEKKANQAIGVDSVNTAYDQAINEWSVANEGALAPALRETRTQQPAIQPSIGILGGGLTAQKIKDDIEALRAKRASLSGSGTPEAKQEIEFIDNIVARLDSFSTNLTPGFESAITGTPSPDNNYPGGIVDQLDFAAGGLTPRFEEALRKDPKKAAADSGMASAMSAINDYYNWSLAKGRSISGLLPSGIESLKKGMNTLWSEAKGAGVDFLDGMAKPVENLSVLGSDRSDPSVTDKVLLGAADAYNEAATDAAGLARGAGAPARALDAISGLGQSAVNAVRDGLKITKRTDNGPVSDFFTGIGSKIGNVLGDLFSEPQDSATGKGKIDAKDANGNEYTKNPDGTFARKGGGGNFTYDPNTKRFISTAAGQPKTTPVPTGAGNTGGASSSSSQGTSKSTVGEKSNKVKVLQEYLNGFFSAKALEQKGYTRGDNGELYDPEGKRVPIDKISTTAVNEQIAADGKFGQETEAALKLYNALNPKEQINYRTVGGALYLDESPVAEGAAAKTPFRQYLETGKVPRYDRSKVQVGEMTPKSKAGTVDLKNFKEMGIKEALPVVPIQPSQKKAEAPAGRVSGSGLTAANLNRLGGNTVDLLKMGVALRSANQPIPPYEESEDWKKYGQIVENRLNQGLSPEVQAQFNQNLNQNRMSGYAQIAAASGGGGSQGAVLGALGQVNQATAGAIGQFAVADQSQRGRNLAQFGSLAAQRENVNLGMYQQGVSRIERNNMQAASIIPQIGANIEARNNYYRAVESPDSPYQKFMKSQLDKQQAETELAQRIAANPSLLMPSAVTPLAPGGLSQKDTSLINQTAKRLGQ